MTGCVSYVMTNYGYTESAANDYCFNSQGMGSCAGDCVGNTLDCAGNINGTTVMGDLNSSGVINIADVVFLVNYILGADQLSVSCGDVNGDGLLNVSDVISIVNIILADRLFGNLDAINSNLIITDSSISLESDGFVQGIHLSLSHDSKLKLI